MEAVKRSPAHTHTNPVGYAMYNYVQRFTRMERIRCVAQTCESLSGAQRTERGEVVAEGEGAGGDGRSSLAMST